MSFVVGQASLQGRRNRQEDACGISMDVDGWDLLIVSDGMGGHANGNLASQRAIECFVSFFEASKGKVEPLQDENALTPWEAFVLRVKWTFRQVSNFVADTGGGATLSVLFRRQRDNRAVVAWVGDSTMARVRRAEKGFEVVRQICEHGLGPYLDRMVGYPTRGERKVSEPDIADWGPMVPGELFVVMSDGVSGVLCTAPTRDRYASFGTPGLLTDSESFEGVLVEICEGPEFQGLDTLAKEPLGLHALANALCQRAIDAGGTDNCTMILAMLAEGEAS